MSKQTGEKVHMMISADYYFRRGMQLLSMKKGRPMSELLIEAAIKAYPEIEEQRQKVVRRTLG